MDPLPTGVPGLDHVLGGGVPGGDTLLVVGDPGSGKTTLALQAAFHTAARGRAVCFVATTSESTSKLLAHARAFEFYDETVIGRRLFFVGLYPLVQQGLETARAALEHQVREHDLTLLVLDGLMTLHGLHPDSRELRRFIYELGSAVWALDCTLILTSSRSDPRGSAEYAEFTTADGLLRLGQDVQGARSVRTLQVVKVRGQSPVPGVHSLRLDRRGVALFPRFESRARADESAVPEARVASGIAELDHLISGGLPAASITVVAGAVGTGKTLLSLQFLLKGARSGERSLLISLRESRADMIRKAHGFELDLETPLRDGTLVFRHWTPVDLCADRVIDELSQTIDHGDYRRFVLDGIAELGDAVPAGPRRTALMVVVASLLRSRSITAVIPAPVSQVVGPELDLGRTPLAGLAQNLVLLRFVEYRSELYRILSILKARDSDFDASIRRYVITRHGLRVLARLEDADGLLTGIAHLSSEARVTRSSEPELP